MSCFGLFEKQGLVARQAKRNQKLKRQQEKQQREDNLRQTDPSGLLKITLKPGLRRESFTATDPGKFYNEKGHWTDIDVYPGT